MKPLKNLWELLKKNKESALHILTLVKQEKGTDEILQELKEKTDLPEEAIKVASGLIDDLKKVGFDDEGRNILGAVKLPKKKLREYANTLFYILTHYGQEDQDNVIWCMASFHSIEERTEVLAKLIDASYDSSGKFSVKRLAKMLIAFGTNTNPKDPFSEKMEEVDKIIKNAEEEVRKVIKITKKKVKSVKKKLDEFENWLNANWLK